MARLPQSCRGSHRRGKSGVKWAEPNGSVQFSADKRFSIVKANSQHWIAYEMAYTTARELGVKPTDTEARQCCEDHVAIKSAQIDADKGMV
jgi:hypothetical protein